MRQRPTIREQFTRGNARDKLVGVFDYRVGSGPAALAFGFHGGSAPVAFDVHLKDRCMMNKSVHRSEGHGGIGKDPVPFSKGLIGGDHYGSPLIS